MARKPTSMRKLITSSSQPAVPATVFKAKCAEAMDAVHALRRNIVVTKHGKPFVTISPAETTVPDPVGFMRGTVAGADDLVEADHKSWAEAADDPLSEPR